MSKDLLSFLLVDDFEMIRVVVRRALAELGYTNVEEASNGREALAKIKSAVAKGTIYDVVFCDWVMPDVDGLQVLQAVRAAEATKRIPIIMLTAEADQKSVVTAMKAGANDYIVKPVNVKTIGEKLDRLLTKLDKKVS